MTTGKFLIGSAIIFSTERMLGVFANFPVAVFPALIVAYLMANQKAANKKVLIASALWFDFFSGYKFGVIVISVLLLTILAAGLFKVINIKSKISPSGMFSAVLLVVIYFLIQFIVLSVLSGGSLIADLGPFLVLYSQDVVFVLAQLFIVYLLFLFRTCSRPPKTFNEF